MMNGYALEAVSDRNSSPVRGVPFNGSYAPAVAIRECPRWQRHDV